MTQMTVAWCVALLTIATFAACEPRVDVGPAPPPATPSRAAQPTPTAGASAAPPSARADAGALVATTQVDAAAPPPEPVRDPRLPGSYRDNSASTAVHTPDRKLFIAGQDRSARHTHGGAPARVGSVTFAVTNDSEQARTIAVQRIEFLRDHGCDAPPSTVASRPKVGGLAFEDDDDVRNKTKLEIAPGTSREVRVGFQFVEAYYVWCDRFAIRAHFMVDGRHKLAPIAELAVTRVEPLRR